MNRDSVTDYLAYILFRLIGSILRKLPKGFSLFLGRRVGDLFFCLDCKHKAIAYSNIKTALGDKLSTGQLRLVTRRFYRAYGQNLAEIFLIPKINKHYLDKYINIEGLDNIKQGFEKGKGIIFLAVHEGSWELSGVMASILGVPFNFLFREQKKFKRIANLLNQYRTQKGCKIIQRLDQTRQLIEVIKSNEAIGMTLDQGGKSGCPVDFFGRSASMATGAVRIALKYEAVILPIFFCRIRGPYIKLFIDQPFEIKNTGNRQTDIQDNLQRLIHVFEKHITDYPSEYLWSYKIWKHGLDRNILILNDGKAGHLRQSQAVAAVLSEYFKENGLTVKVETEEILFKSRFAKTLLQLSSCISGKFTCQGCLSCLKVLLHKKVYDSLIKKKPNVVISCGASVTPVNFLISRENLAKSIVLMQPSILSTAKFDLVIVPEHDNPPKRKNIIVTEGALNLINENYLKEQADKLCKTLGLNKGFYIGLLIGGDAGNFHLKKDTVLEVLRQVKSACENLGADILVTTSRRTSREIEDTLKEELRGYSNCKMLIIANEKNIPEAVGGILGLSQIVITSAESISMISEAASSKKYVLVFTSANLDKKHARFLKNFSQKQYIRLIENASDLKKNIEEVWFDKPGIRVLSDSAAIKEAVKRIF